MCQSNGMRLPTVAEWRGLVIPIFPARDAHCASGSPTSISPFDSAAFSGPIASGDHLWTGTPETGFAGYVMVVRMQFDGNTRQWFAADTDDVMKDSTTHAYRCVK